jgi:hypothetical protein
MIFMLRKIGGRKAPEQMAFSFGEAKKAERKTVPFVSMGMGHVSSINLELKREQKYVVDLLKHAGIIPMKAGLREEERRAIIEFAKSTQKEILALNGNGEGRKEKLLTLKLPVAGGIERKVNFKLRIGANGRAYILPNREISKALRTASK